MLQSTEYQQITIIS